jgi:Tfp pilus assembly protein PilV
LTGWSFMKARNQGFMLVEVVLAVVVLSVGIVAVSRASGASLRGLTLYRDRYRAQLLLESRVWLLGVGAEVVPESDAALSSVTWTVDDDADTSDTLCRWRKVTIGWGEKKRGGELSLSSAVAGARRR